MPDRNPDGMRRDLGDVLRDFVRHQDPEKFKRDLKALVLTLPVLKQLEAARIWLDKPVTGGRDASKPDPTLLRHSSPDRAETKYQTPSGRPSVQPAHGLPRTGRSSWLNGLLRGPWG